MTRIYFADKVEEYLGVGKKRAAKGIIQQDSVFQKTPSKQPDALGDSPDQPVAGKKSKADQSWGSSMRGLFNIIAWVSQHGVYRMFNHQPFELLNGWGHLFGMLFLGRSRSVRKKIRMSLQALYPHWSRKKIEKYTVASIKYMGTMFLDFMFRLPHTCDYPDEKFWGNPFYTYEGIDKLDAAIAKGKGVICPTLHTGEFFHSIAGIFQYPKHYYCGGVAALSNLVLYRMNNRKHFDGLHIFASTDFNKISGILERFVQHNGILTMAHDYASPRQLRVPMIYGKYPYLVNVPQSYISIQRKTGAEVVPIIPLPNKVLGKTRVVFLDNTSIMDVIHRYADAPKKEFHGHVSTEINRVLYPIVKSYAHNWEEIMNLGSIRLADKVEFPANCTIQEFITAVIEKMQSVLENSFEPERDDTKLTQAIDAVKAEIMPLLTHGDAILRSHPTKIDLSRMDSLSELIKLGSVAAKELAAKGEIPCAERFHQVNKLFNEHVKINQCYHEILVEEHIDFSLTDRIWDKIHGVVENFWNYEEKMVTKLKTYEEIFTARLKALKAELTTRIRSTIETVKAEYKEKVK